MKSGAASKRYVLVLFLWCLFTLICFAAPFIAILFPMYRKRSYLRRIVKTADCLVASVLGFSGVFTLSAELAHSKKYKWLHDMLNMIEEDHCENELFEEGAYCRIRDRQRGDK
jgi:hypothetical protein